jgi:PAS domain S-box-containing protein
MRFEENSSFSSSQLDFVPRDRRRHGSRIIVAFIFIVLFICLFGLLPDLASALQGHLILAIGVALLAIYVVMQSQRMLDLAMSAEYQNLLFAQALSLGTSFCLFARRDGTIVYANDGVRALFGNAASESQALETVFKSGGVATTDRERIMGAIYSNAGERLVFPITSASGQQKNYVLTVEPLTRPSGFVMIRGREYRGERAGTQVMPNMLRTTSADKLDHMLSATPIGHYATDAFGRFEYVNQAFEQVLGYSPGEVISSRLSLSRVLYRLNDRAVSGDYSIGDFSGDAVVQGKSGTTSNCMLYQTVIRDDAGKAIGASGSIISATMLD